jgi:hypothetical protein
VGWSQIIFGAALVVVLLALSFYFGWRQLQALRALRRKPDLPREEARHELVKAWRRLISCALTLILAGLLATLMLFFEDTAQRFAEERLALPDNQRTIFNPQEKTFIRVYTGTWIALLLVLLVVVLLAAIDLWATRRHGLRAYRKLQADRRAMIERQVIRLRQERNGHA